MIILDTGVLGKIIYPFNSENAECAACFRAIIGNGRHIGVPEIADYELRRKLIHIGSHKSIGRLDSLIAVVAYLPITTRIMRSAAHLWASAREKGRPTAGESRLDIDTILAAQSLAVMEKEGEALIATTNPRHLSLFAEARNWREIDI